MCLPIGSMLLRSKILWMKHVVFWREPDGVIPRATGDWLTGRWDSRKVLRHCHNTWKTSTYARRCWSSRFWHSDWKSGLFPDFYRKYSKVRTFPGPGGQQLKIRTFPGNKDPWEPCISQHGRMITLFIAMKEAWTFHHSEGLVQGCNISSALSMEILQSCTKPLIQYYLTYFITSDNQEITLWCWFFCCTKYSLWRCIYTCIKDRSNRNTN